MSIGERLIALREGRPQSKIAEELGICRSALSMYENDERIPREEIKVRISNYYGVSVQDLFYSQEDHVS